MQPENKDDADLDALVIRNIGDIEAALKHAVDVLGPVLWREAGRTVLSACDSATHHASATAEDEDVWVTARSWLLPDSATADADFWLGLDERTALGDDGENSWLATYTGRGPNGATMALWVDQKIVGKPRWKKIVRSSNDSIEELREAGFEVVEDDDRRLCIPVVLYSEALVAAFASEDFLSAMQAVGDAVRKAIAATPALERLRTLAQAAA